MRYIVSVVVALSAVLASANVAHAQGNLTIDVSGVPGTGVTAWTFSGSYTVDDVSQIANDYSFSGGQFGDERINDFDHEDGTLSGGIALTRIFDSIYFPFLSSTAQVSGSASGVHLLDAINMDSDELDAGGDDFAWYAQGMFQDGETLTFSGTATIAVDLSLFLEAGDTSRSISSVGGGLSNNPADFVMNFTLASSEDPTTKVAAILESLVVLESGGTLSGGLANALSAKLGAALGQVEEQSQAAVGMLTAFIHQVSALMQSGRLSAAEGQDLIAAAESVLADLTN